VDGRDLRLGCANPYIKKTAVPQWTPLSSTGSNPVTWQGTLAEDTLPKIVPGEWCVRVRARADRAPGNQEVWGDYTYLSTAARIRPRRSVRRSNGRLTPTRRPGVGRLRERDSRLPVRRRLQAAADRHDDQPNAPLHVEPSGRHEQLLRRRRQGRELQQHRDEAFTQIPAYAPRNSLKPTTYSDETTLFYWAVLPGTPAGGNDAPPLSVGSAAKGSFQKQSTPPDLVSPSAVQAFLDQPTFRWTPTLGARRYRLQVAADPTFGSPLDDVVTDATSYSSDTTYPADTVLYWRVRADDENLTGLTWSATGTFQKKLAAPVASASNPTKGESLPVWAWSSVQGAASYDLSVDQPDGSHRDYSDIRTPAASFIKMTGTGVWHWRVRAEFPKDLTGTVPGPYMATQSFTRTIGEPANAKTDSAKDHILLSWDPRLGVKEYKVQIASSPTSATSWRRSRPTTPATRPR
jgi:hypothetical protein